MKNKKMKTQENVFNNNISTKLKFLAGIESTDLLKKLGTSDTGLKNENIEKQREIFGDNKIAYQNQKSLIHRIFNAFINPFTMILLFLATISFVMDILIPVMNNHADEADFLTLIIIITMVIISGLLRFTQETRSGNAAQKLLEMITTTTCVERDNNGKTEISLDEVVVGDIIHLAAGDMIPADMRILKAKDLFISQSSLTGESEPIEKFPAAVQKEYDSFTDYPNLLFMGSNVVSGTAKGVVVSTGQNTMFGTMAKSISDKPVITSFEKGVNSVSWVLIRFMFVMVPIVLFVNGFTKGNWMEAFLFAISIAVGLTPEMLPMIVTTCLAKGAVAMSKKKTIIKNLNSIQNFGAMDILCTDKTGTITQNKVILEYHLDVQGKEDTRVLKHAFLNSYYQTGLRNLMDIAIINRTLEEKGTEDILKDLALRYEKVDEIPFDFNRRRMSVVVSDSNGKKQMITKGAVEEMLSVCSFVEYSGNIEPITYELKEKILKTADELNEDGMRVIAVAQKTNPSPADSFSVKDETDMVLMGYLAFLDPPKDSAAAAIKSLSEYGVTTKILTGDNDKVTACICKQVGIKADNILLGSEIESLTDTELSILAEETNVFAKLSPNQKKRIVDILRANGHTVGFMGDGINDAAAMKASDIGISVDSAVDIAKESADIILLEKDLSILKQGIIEGRITYANMIKYIKMTASSNFGNMFSVLAASAFIPFLPMMSIHLIFLNLIYDISCIAIPWDNVDKEFLKIPRKWDASSVGNFMIWIGPASSVFDITTYLLMYFIICPKYVSNGVLYNSIPESQTALRALYISVFQAGWFIESMWSQTLVIHMIRTPKIPFIQSRASFPIFSLTFTGIALLTIIPFTKFGAKIGLAPLPFEYFGWLILTIILYMFLATILKNLYVKRYKELL